MNAKIKIIKCEDISWVGRPMTCVHLEEDRPMTPWKRVLVDGSLVEPHFSMPSTNRSLFYSDGLHDLVGSLVEFAE